jgi:enamine deaminase RidA (YjgF/YER057c/UK114 family)
LKVTVYLTDLAHFQEVNAIMEHFLQAPYPARTTVGVLALPRGALVEFDAIIALP